MTYAVLALALVVVGLGATLVVARRPELVRRRPALDELVGRIALATLDDGTTLVGTIVELRRGWLILGGVDRLEADGSRTPIDGRAMMATRHLVLVQLP